MILDGIKEIFTGKEPYLVEEKPNEKENIKLMLGPILSEGGSMSVSAMNHAIETAEDITDHVHINPDVYSIKTFLVDANDLLASGISAASSSIFGGSKPQTVEEKMEQLKTWKNAGTLLTYNGPRFSVKYKGTSLKNGYDVIRKEVIILRIDWNRSQSSGEGLEVTLSLQKVIIATAATTRLNRPKRTRSKKKKKVDGSNLFKTANAPKVSK